jgi:hypothetical protein
MANAINWIDGLAAGVSGIAVEVSMPYVQPCC